MVKSSLSNTFCVSEIANLRIYPFSIAVLIPTWGRTANHHTALLFVKPDLMLNLIFYSPSSPVQPNISKNKSFLHAKLHQLK